MPKTELPSIEEVKLSSLVIDYALAGRSEKEVKANAKELAPMLVNGWSPSQPGEYFERDGKKHLAAGFTRYTAALANELKVGYLVKVPDRASELRTTAIRTNASKPISPFEQGRIYAGMRDGTKAEDIEVEAEVLAPMKIVDIAATVGKTRQHIDSCIAVFENPEEIAELITSGKVSAGVVVRAKQLVKGDEKKLIKAVKMIVKHATDEGKETATMKDLEICRPDFAPLKAATKPAPEKPANAPEPTPAPEVPENVKSHHGGEPDGESEPESSADDEPNPASSQPEQSQPELFTEPENASPRKTAKKQEERVRQDVRAIIEKLGDECAVSFSDSDLDQFVDALSEYVLKVASAPF